MNPLRERAAQEKLHIEGPPRLNSSRCGNYHTAANGLNQSTSSAAPVRATNKQTGEDMSYELIAKREEQEEFAIIEQVVLQGDLSKLNPKQRVLYYNKVCKSSGLNPFTSPFAYISLNGKLTLYAKKDCTEQLRKINGVSIEELDDKLIEDIYIVTAKARDKNGRVDQAKGAVVLTNLKGEAKANAIMKAETKAKRRVTLSICGMGFTDESEIDSIPNSNKVDVDISTGEIKGQSNTNNISEKPKYPIIESKQLITIDQAVELEIILSQCNKDYREWIYKNLMKEHETNDFCDLSAELFDRMKSAFVKNMENNQRKIKEEEQVLVSVEIN